MTIADLYPRETKPMDDRDLHEELVALGRAGRKRVLRVLSGEATPEDEAVVRDWLREDPRRAELIDQIRRARVAAELAPEVWGDLDDAYARVLARIGATVPAEADTAPVEPAAPRHPDPVAEPAVLPFRTRPAAAAPARRGWGRRIGAFARVAATVVLLVGSALVWQRRDTLFGPAEAPLRELAAATGQRIQLTLTDGSKVVLGPNSRLYFPERFGRTRLLRLEGEAVFDVVSDSARPFLVQTRTATTRVLGTRFGVRAYPEDEYVEVVVAEGRVAVMETEDQTTSSTTDYRGMAGPLPADAIQLTADQAVRLVPGTPGAIRTVDATRFLAWTEGSLYFERTPLPEVARILENRYGLEIELADERVADLRLTAEFVEPELITEVVRLIAVSLGIEYRKTAEGYLFVYPDQKPGTTSTGGLER